MSYIKQYALSFSLATNSSNQTVELSQDLSCVDFFFNLSLNIVSLRILFYLYLTFMELVSVW